jgi:hypothetical protein
MARRNAPCKRRDSVAIRERLATLRPEDFDGHTEFAGLTPEQRLVWLSQVAQFVVIARHTRRSLSLPNR